MVGIVAADDDEKEAYVEHHVEDSLQLESLSAAPLVERGVGAHAHQQQPAQPEQEVEEEHCVLGPSHTDVEADSSR